MQRTSTKPNLTSREHRISWHPQARLGLRDSGISERIQVPAAASGSQFEIAPGQPPKSPMGQFRDSTPDLVRKSDELEPKLSVAPTVTNLGWLTRSTCELQSGGKCKKIRDNVYFCKGIERGCTSHSQATRIGEIFAPETNYCLAARFADMIDSTRGGFFLVEEQLDQGFKVKRCVRSSLPFCMPTILE